MQISFSPQGLLPTQTWEVSSGLLTTPEGKHILVESIVEIRYSDGSFRRRFSAFFDLVTSDEEITIWCEDRFRGERRHRYFILLFALLESLQLHNPHVLVQLGPSAQTRFWTVAVGCVPTLFGLVFLSIALEEANYLAAITIGLFSLISTAFILWDVPLNPESSTLTLEAFEVWLSDRTKEELSQN
mgnify:CR=1 FL=1